MKKIIFLIYSILMFTACENTDFFELERPVENPWLTLTEFERAPIGVYKEIFSAGSWGNKYNYWYLYKNAVADDCAWATPGDNTWGWYRDTEFNKAYMDHLFRSSYKVIASINDAFKFLEDNDGTPYPKISPEDKTYNLDRIIGELYFMRGFAYYMNATVFCDAYVPDGANDGQQIPYRLTSATSYEEAANSKIGTTQEIWDLILADFQKAYEMLPERYIEGKMHPSYQAGRANKFAAAAMLSRTYFARGNYQKAAEFATFVIDENNGDYDLSEDPIEAFNKSELGRGKETILYIPCYDETTASQNLHAATFNHLLRDAPVSWVATHMDYATLQRIGWMNDPKNDTTININARRDKRFQQLFAVREPANIPEEERVEGRYYETRVNLEWRTILANKLHRGPNVGYTNVPQIRLAEMYLTRSVCNFRAGNKQDAADDLNVVRKRAWDETVAGVS
ncbi:RagB/SusD family nutrient uptake outer membrane protein, partial [Mariniphaga sediminis]|uniref:RagB/SusD family nutrient uptake outer membrane protein n=1 Tax=Mariniphaga sediminis TaxID=1628158 RepID=UPI003568F644